MVKLATARECRDYSCGAGGRRLVARNRWEYINAGVYVFAAVLLVGGFWAQLSPWARSRKSGLAVVAVGLVGVLAVNVHDLVAHMSGVDWHLGLAGSDSQLALVEFAVPTVQIVGAALTFAAVLFFEIQMERGYRHKLENHGLNLLIAGPVFWCLGSIHNTCQVYECVNGHVQMLQKSVQVPLLLGSLLFLIGGIVAWHDIHNSYKLISFELVGKSWVWFCLFGSLLFFIGGILNLLKVFKLQQMDGWRLEKLRGGAQEALGREREGKVPLILENRRRKQIDNVEDPWAPRQGPGPVLGPATAPGPVPEAPSASYKEALVGGTSASQE